MMYKLRKLLFGSKIKRACSLKKKSWLKEKWHDFLDDLYDWYTDLIIVPIEWIQRFISWGWRCKWNYTFVASHSTYMLIYYNLKDMIDYSRKYGHCLWNQEHTKQFRKLKIACELAKRLWENDYKVHMNQHNKKWGKLYMEFGEAKNNSRRCYLKRKVTEENPHLKNVETKEWQIAHNADEQQKKNERKYLFKLLEKHLEGWWD